MITFTQTTFQNIPQLFLAWSLRHGVKIVLILIAAAVARTLTINYISKFIGTLIKKAVGKDYKLNGQKALTLIHVVNSILNFTIWIFALIMILPEFGVNIAPLLAGLGIAGLALGMGVRDLIQDYIGGFLILMEDQYRVGEKIKVVELNGEVIDLDLRKTVLKDVDGTLHYISNRQIKTSSNYSRK